MKTVVLIIVMMLYTCADKCGTDFGPSGVQRSVSVPEIQALRPQFTACEHFLFLSQPLEELCERDRDCYKGLGFTVMRVIHS